MIKSRKNKFCSTQNLSDLFLGDCDYKDMFVSSKDDEKYHPWH